MSGNFGNQEEPDNKDSFFVNNPEYDYLRAYENTPTREQVINRIKMEYPEVEINSKQFNVLVQIELQSMTERELELRKEFTNKWTHFVNSEL